MDILIRDMLVKDANICPTDLGENLYWAHLNRSAATVGHFAFQRCNTLSCRVEVRSSFRGPSMSRDLLSQAPLTFSCFLMSLDHIW